MLELIRRLMLAGGIAGFFALALTTVPALVLVAPVDFAAEMAREYRLKPEPRLKGVMELAEEYIRQTTKPASLQEYIHRKTEHRLIKVGGADWEEFFRAVGQGAASPYPVRQVGKRGAYVFRWEETPLAALKDRIETMSRTWTVNYLVLRPDSAPQYLEVRYGYGFEPKKVGAPASLVFPWRSYCWIPLLVGAAGFAILRGRRPGTEIIYPNYLSSGLALDVIGLLFFSLFFAIPFWVSDPTQEMWGQDLGITLWCWLAAAGALSLVVVAGVNASGAIRLEPGRLVVSRLLGSRTLDLGEITAATPLLVGGIESGLILELRDQSRVKLPWDNLVNYQLLLEALSTAGIKVQSAHRTEAGQAETGPSATGEISWDFNTPLLTNQFIVYDLLKVWGFSTLFLGLLMAGIAAYDRNWRTFADMAPVVGAVSAGLLVLLILVMLVFFGNRFPMGFRLDPQGAMVVSRSRRGRWGNRLAVILGALAGKPGVAGAGLLGMAQETVGVVWDDVRRVNIHAPARVISLMDSWHVVFRLYCTPQNYAVVLNAVQKWAAGGLKKAAQAPRAKGLTPTRRLWLKSLLVVVAAFLVTALPLEMPPVLIWSLVLVSLGGIWFLVFERFFGIISLALVGVILLISVGQGLEVRQTTTAEDFRRYAQSQGLKVDKVPDWVLGKHRRYEHFHTGEWLQTGIAALGLAFFGWVGLAALRPRRRRDAVSEKSHPGTS
ncbi:MAG: hypothetical protein Q8L00_01885 [Deltaproteobacteria bacterium]|nr:hypothetical protein [Deltaproteobacteria bacterium]